MMNVEEQVGQESSSEDTVVDEDPVSSLIGSVDIEPEDVDAVVYPRE